MKKILILALILTLTLTSCVAAVNTKEVIEDIKAPVVEEKEEVAETPKAPEVPVEPAIPVTPETTIAPEEVEVPVTEPETTEEPNEPEGGDEITPDENETLGIEVHFNDVTEEDLQDIFNAITGGEAIEFPIIPIE